MTAFIATRRNRSADLVIQLDRQRVEWTGRYIEWHSLGCLPEARLALENLRAVQRGLRRAMRVARVWFWISR